MLIFIVEGKKTALEGIPFMHESGTDEQFGLLCKEGVFRRTEFQELQQIFILNMED